jgi:hypothetical protein
MSLLPVGCSTKPADSDHHAEGEDGEMHLEHFVPAHKPASLSLLVEQIKIRTGRLADRSPEAGSIDKALEIQELKDIVNWIPELAADSDLKKAQFDEAALISRELLTIVQKQFEGNAGGDGKSSPDSIAFDSAIGRLTKLCLDADGQNQRLTEPELAPE